MNILQKLLALIFTPTVSGAVAGIEKAVKNLAVVEAHHAAQVVKHDLAIAKATAKQAISKAEQDAAGIVRDNILKLLGKG